MKKFKELKRIYGDQVVTAEQFDDIEENENVERAERNGGSGLYEDCMWFTVYSVDNEEFDFYVRIK